MTDEDDIGSLGLNGCHENLTIVVGKTGRTVTVMPRQDGPDGVMLQDIGADNNKLPQSTEQMHNQSTVGSPGSALFASSQTESVSNLVSPPPPPPSLTNIKSGSAFTAYSLATVFTKSDTGYVGLVNQAMTCYLNSLLQTLFMTPEFCNAIYRWQYTGTAEDGKKSIPYQLQRLFLKLQTSHRRSIETTAITRSFGWDSSEAWQQHDIQELCRAMFDALEKTWENTSQANIINELYEGKMKDCVQCLQCGFESARTVSYLDVQLPVRPFGASVDEAYSSVEEALKAFCAAEVLDGNNQFYCEHCQTKRNAHKSLKFETFPYLLTIHLLRFDFDYNTLRRIKLNHRITFPDVLDVKEYVTSTTTTVNGVKNNDCPTPDSNCESSSCDSQCGYEYELFSIMIHSGNATGGHYYAYIKSFETSDWFSFNDQQVTKITSEDITQTFGGSTESGMTASYASSYVSSTNAYMLMYRRIDKQQNTVRMTVDEFPPHLRDELQKLQEYEDTERHLQAIERTTCKIKLFVNHPKLQKMVESTLCVDMNATLEQATETAWKLCELDSIVPLDCVRLVKYDALHDYIDRSFDGEETHPMHKVLGAVRFIYSFDLLLEIKRPDQVFPVYQPGGVGVKMYVVDLTSESISSPVTLRVYLQQTVADLKALIVNELRCKLDDVRVVLDVHSDLRPLTDDERPLKLVGFGKNNKIFVECSGCERDLSDFKQSSFYQLLDRIDNTIHIKVYLPAPSEVVNELSTHLATTSVSDSVTSVSDSVTSVSSIASCSAVNAASDDMLNGDVTNISSPQLVPEGIDSLGTSHWTNNATATSWLSTGQRSTIDPTTPGTDGVNTTSVTTFGDKSSRYFAAVPSSDDQQHCLNVAVDKRITIKALKQSLQPFVGVGVDNFDLYRVLSNGDELEMKRTYETMSLYDNNSDFRVKLSRQLRFGEYRVNVYQFLPTEQKPIKFLSEAVVFPGMTVSQFKQTIIDELKSKQQLAANITLDRCRLRKKSYKSPSTIYSDTEIFDVEGINLVSNMDVFIEILNEPDRLRANSSSELSVYVRRWSPSKHQIGPITEVFVDESSSTDLVTKFAETCGINVENVEFARMPGSFPCDVSVLEIHTSLPWHSPGVDTSPVEGATVCAGGAIGGATVGAEGAVGGAAVSTVDTTRGSRCLNDFSVYSDGAVFCCRDKTEQLQQLTDEQRKAIEQSETSRFLLSTNYSVKSRVKERALKIYTDDVKST